MYNGTYEHFNFTALPQLLPQADLETFKYTVATASALGYCALGTVLFVGMVLFDGSVLGWDGMCVLVVCVWPF